ncbi:hypothetical protein BDW75DRAFT_250008 [Aspergillus navahoensis]
MVRSQKPKSPDDSVHQRFVCPPPRRDSSTERTEIGFDTIRIYAWPSRGGVIVPTNANIRDRDQDAEDKVCKQLLYLGATWYDSKVRFKLVAAVLDGGREARNNLAIKAGWPSTGGLWVVEFGNPRLEDVMSEVDGDGVYEVDYVGGCAAVMLARDMDERCEILRSLGGRFYASLMEYDGDGCLKAWEVKRIGEPLSLRGLLRGS